MRYSLFLVLPVILAGARSLAFGLQTSSQSGVQHTIPVEDESEFLLGAIFCLLGLLLSTYLMTRFPELGSQIAELNQF